MLHPEPLDQFFPKLRGKRDHLARLLVRGATSPLIIADVAFLSKCVQLGNRGAVRSESECQRMDGAMVVRFPGRPEALGCESGNCHL